MGILDGIVEWIAEQVMAGLDLITTSVLGALGCDMAVFLRYFPAAETMYSVFVALGIGIILLNWVWQLFKNFGLGAGIEAEDPLKLSIRSVIFILLAFFSNEIVSMILTIGGTPYNWIMDSELPALSFADFNSVMLVIIGVCANGAVALITLILVIILAWNYLKLLLEAAERYVLLGVLVYTAPVRRWFPGTAVWQLRGVETGRRHSRRRNFSGDGIARFFYLSGLRVSSALRSVRCPDLHRPVGNSAAHGHAHGLQRYRRI